MWSSPRIISDEIPDVRDVAGDGGGGGHGGAHQVGAAAAALAAFEVAVGGGGAALPGGGAVWVQAQAHGAAGLPPFEAGGGEDLVEAFGFRLLADQAGARDDHGADALGDLAAFRDL